MAMLNLADGTYEIKADIWIQGHCGKADPQSLDAADFYPDYQFTTVNDALRDPELVFSKPDVNTDLSYSPVLSPVNLGIANKKFIDDLRLKSALAISTPYPCPQNQAAKDQYKYP